MERRTAKRASEVGGGRRVLAVGLAVFVLAWILRVLYVMDLQASPLADVPLLDELEQLAFAHERVGQVQARKLDLL